MNHKNIEAIEEEAKTLCRGGDIPTAYKHYLELPTNERPILTLDEFRNFVDRELKMDTIERDYSRLEILKAGVSGCSVKTLILSLAPLVVMVIAPYIIYSFPEEDLIIYGNVPLMISVLTPIAGLTFAYFYLFNKGVTYIYEQLDNSFV